MLMTQPRTAVNVTSAQLRVLAEQFAEWSESMKRIAEVADQQSNRELALFNWSSVPKGLQLIGSFITRAQESRRQALMGTPILPGQLMPTSRAKLPSTPGVQTASEMEQPKYIGDAELHRKMEQVHRKRESVKPAPEVKSTKKKKA